MTTGLSPSPATDAEPTPADGDGIWARVGRLVTTHPVRVLLVSLAVLLLPLLALPQLRLSNDTLAELPADAGSVRGFELLRDHFPVSAISPIILVIDDQESVLAPASLRALGDLSRNLRRIDGVATVRSVAMPTDGAPPELDAQTQEVLAQVDALGARLGQAADGASQLASGAARVRDGLARVERELPRLREGAARAAAGAVELERGLEQLEAGAAELRDGLAALADGLRDARDGAVRLRDDVAAPSEEAVREAWDALSSFTVGRTDPEYERAARATGELHGRLTGEDPRTGQQVEPGYDGLTAALDDLAAGLDGAISGAEQLAEGSEALRDGLVQARGGAAELADGLRSADSGVVELQDGIEALRAGAARLAEGSDELATRLDEGAVQVQQADLGAVLDSVTGGEDAGPFIVTPGLLEARPQLREELAFFLAEDDTRTRLFIGLDRSPFSPEALDTIPRIEDVASLSLSGSPLADAAVLPTGATAFFDDVDAAADRDFALIVVAVIVGVFLVLVLLLRALVAPAYLVATVLLSFASALGLTTIWFQGVQGHEGIAWWLPPFLYVLLVALGADYNIYLMSRVREEAEHASTRVAVAEATRLTGGVITSAGLILAGSFAALMAADMRSLAQMGFATTVGILLDTFVVRTLLVPSIATLLGRHNWWPSRRGRDLADD